jgi:hypothetical protein
MPSHNDGLQFLCSAEVKVLFEDESWNTHSAVGNLEGFGSHSATLLMDEPLPPWRPVAISLKGQDLYGIVESNEIDDLLGCFVTIQLNSPYRWTHPSSLPDHSLDLGKLTRQTAPRRTAKSFTLVHR